MKKLFTLLCALSVILSASAAPLGKKARMDKYARVNAKEVKVQKDLTSAKVQKSAGVFESRQKAVASKGLLKNKAKSAINFHRAPKALAEVQQVIIGSVDPQDWGGDVQYYLYSTDNKIAFVFDVIYGEGLEDVELGKTYTLEEMDAEYSGVFYSGEWHGLSAAEFTKTVDAENMVHIAGTCADTLGAEFVFTYDEVPFTPTGDTIRFALDGKARFTRYASYGQWHVAAEGEQYAFAADYYSDDDISPIKVDSLDYDYCRVEIYNAEDDSWLQIASHEDNVSLEISKDGETILVAMTLLGEDGNVYEAKATFVEPKKEAEETISADNLVFTVEDYYFFYDITYIGFTDKYGVVLQAQSSSSAATGEFEIGDNMSGYIFLFSETDTTEVELYSGNVVVAQENGGVKLSGKVLAFNNTEYTLDLTYVLPEAGRKETITTSDAAITLLGTAWQLQAFNADESRYVTIAALTEEPAGTYSLDDLYTSYTYVGVFQNGDTAWYDPIDANIVVAVEGEVAKVTGTILGQNDSDATDVVEFTLDITAALQEAQDETYKYDDESDYERVFASYEVDDRFLAEYGSVYVEAEDAEGFGIILDIWVPENADGLVPGVYPLSESMAPQTATSGFYDADYGLTPSFAYTLIEEEGELYYNQLWWLVEGEITVNDDLSITVDAKNSLGHTIKATLNVDGGLGVENTAAAVKVSKRIENGQIVIDRNGVRFNAIGAQIQ